MIPVNKVIALALVIAVLCICFTGCRTKKDNNPTEGQTEPGSVLSSDPSGSSDAPTSMPTLPEDSDIPSVTETTGPNTDPTQPNGNGQNGGNGQGNSGGNQNGSSSNGGSQTPVQTDPTTPPTTEAPVPPTTTDPIPETSEPEENETEPTEEEDEDRIELPVVTWPSGS